MNHCLRYVVMAMLILLPAVAWPESVLVGIDVERAQIPAQLAKIRTGNTSVSAVFTRHSVLLGQSVPDMLLISEPTADGATDLRQAAVLYIPGMPHPIPGIEQAALATQVYTEYTMVTLRLAPGVSFEQCEAQMAKVLKLARRYGAQPLETWRVNGVAKGLPNADLFGLIGWSSGASALRFALKLRSEGQGVRPAHDLNDENALVVQVKPL